MSPGGSTRRWRRIRLVILARDQYRCRVTLPGCTTTATEVHHVGGKAAGDDPALLVASCSACNERIGNPRHGDPQPRAITRW